MSSEWRFYQDGDHWFRDEQYIPVWEVEIALNHLEALADLARRASEPLYLRRNVGAFLSDHDLAWLRDYEEADNSNVNVKLLE